MATVSSFAGVSEIVGFAGVATVAAILTVAVVVVAVAGVVAVVTAFRALLLLISYFVSSTVGDAVVAKVDVHFISRH